MLCLTKRVLGSRGCVRAGVVCGLESRGEGECEDRSEGGGAIDRDPAESDQAEEIGTVAGTHGENRLRR